MTLIDQFRLLVGGYYGVLEMDDFGTNSYVLKQIEDCIRDFVANNYLSDFDYEEDARNIESIPLKRKLQDSLIVLNMINGPFELVLMIKDRLNELKED